MQRLATVMLLTALVPSMAMAQARETEDVELVSVELSNFEYTPSDLVFQHGRTYRLRLVNTSSGDHDFSARDFFAASKVAVEDQAKVDDGEVDVLEGETVEIILTPVERGTYDLHCSHFMHGIFGMRGSITVK